MGCQLPLIESGIKASEKYVWIIVLFSYHFLNFFELIRYHTKHTKTLKNEKKEWGGPCKSQILRLEPGQMIIFRQDLLHAGSGYVDDNMRWFAYIDMAGVSRKSDRTCHFDFPVNLKDFDKLGYKHY
jgi:hypothetical protein